MKQIMANLTNAVTNWHVSAPVLAAATLAVIPVWLPQYATQLQTTAAILAGYGIIASANTPPNSQTPSK